jgi:hypothetical protein
VNTTKNEMGRLGQILLWIARVGSLLSCGVLLLFVIGEGFDPRRLQPREFELFLCFPLGMALGLVCAWRWAAVGGALTIASLLGFYVLHWAQVHSFPRGWALTVFVAPGFFFLSSAACRCLSRKDPPPC